MEQNAYNNSPVARALRKAGYVPLPRLWVRKEDIPEVQAIAYKYANDVNVIRHKAKGLRLDEPDPSWQPSTHLPTPPVHEMDHGDPIEDKEAAWAAFEKARNSQ